MTALLSLLRMLEEGHTLQELTLFLGSQATACLEELNEESQPEALFISHLISMVQFAPITTALTQLPLLHETLKEVRLW